MSSSDGLFIPPSFTGATSGAWQIGATYGDPNSTDNNISQTGDKERQPASLHGSGSNNLSSTTVPEGNGWVGDCGGSYTLFNDMKHIIKDGHVLNVGFGLSAVDRYDDASKTNQFGGADASVELYYSTPKTDPINFLGFSLGNVYIQNDANLNASYRMGLSNYPTNITTRVSNTIGLYLDNASPFLGFFGLSKFFGIDDMKCDYYAKLFTNYNFGGQEDGNLAVFAPDLLANKPTVWTQLGFRTHFHSDATSVPSTAAFDLTFGETTPGKQTVAGNIRIINRKVGWYIDGNLRTPDTGDEKWRFGAEVGANVIDHPKWWPGGQLSLFCRADHIEDEQKQAYMPGFMASQEFGDGSVLSICGAYIIRPKEKVTPNSAGYFNVFNYNITSYNVDTSGGIYGVPQSFSGEAQYGFKMNDKNFLQLLLGSTGATIYSSEGSKVITLPLYIKSITVLDYGDSGEVVNGKPTVYDISSYFSSLKGTNVTNGITVNWPNPTSYGNKSGNVKPYVDVEYYGQSSDWSTYWNPNSGYHYSISTYGQVYRGQY